MPVAFRVHADRGDAETEKAGVVTGQFRLDRGVIEEVGLQDFLELGVLLAARPARHRKHALDTGIDQAFAQHALPDHSGGAEDDDLHDLKNASRSALMVTASVVGMPCGKLL